MTREEREIAEEVDFRRRRAAFRNNELVQEYPEIVAGNEEEDYPKAGEPTSPYIIATLGFDPDED